MKTLNRGLKLCGQVEVIGGSAITVLERNSDSTIRRCELSGTGPASAAGFAVGCSLTNTANAGSSALTLTPTAAGTLTL